MVEGILGCWSIQAYARVYAFGSCFEFQGSRR